MAFDQAPGFLCFSHAAFYTDLAAFTAHLNAETPCVVIAAFATVPSGSAFPSGEYTVGFPSLAHSGGVVVKTAAVAAHQVPPGVESEQVLYDAGLTGQLILRSVVLPSAFLSNVFARVQVVFHDGTAVNLDNNNQGQSLALNIPALDAVTHTVANDGKTIRKVVLQVVNLTGVAQAGVALGQTTLRAHAYPRFVGVSP